MEWNEERAQEIIKKSKHRYSLRLTFKIIRTLVALFIIYALYMLVLTIVYDVSKIGKRTEFYQQLALDWTDPVLRNISFFQNENEISPLLTQKIEMPLVRRIGKGDYVVSHLKLSKPIFSIFTWTETSKNFPYERDNRGFVFYLPYDPESNRKLDGDRSTKAWDTLNMIHEGNVADLAFSTAEYYSPKEILELLEPYDVHVLWMPVYMGERQKFNEGGWGGGGNFKSINRPWGLSGARLIDDNYKDGYLELALEISRIEESQAAMLKNMETMLRKNKRLAQKLLGTEFLQERYDYLNENGFQAYGAVVTGPVKELLKLQNLDGIHSVILGEVTHWNWND